MRVALNRLHPQLLKMELSPVQVPNLAWTQVPLFGQLTARLLNPGEIKKEGLLGHPPSPSPGLKAQP